MEALPSVLADTDITNQITKGNIVIYPFSPINLQNCSYDVRIGEFYYRPNQDQKIMNPWSKNHMDQYWGTTQLALRADSIMAKQYGISVGSQFLEIYPQETILAHTQEFIGGKNNLVAKMQTRSSVMRSGLSCCRCAGWGDVGYINRWTMEITNHTRTKIIIPVGKRVAQIIFHPTGTPSHTYSSLGKYQTSDDLDQIINSWSPKMMLPRLYQDTD